MTVDQIPIGRFSAVTRLTRKALRYYEAKGLLVPEAKNQFTGYRYYTGGQIQRGVKIRHLSDMGFTVEAMAEYLEAEKAGDRERLSALVAARLEETEAELDRLRRVASLLDSNHIKELMKESMSEPSIKDVPGARVLSKRGKGPIGETIGRLIGETHGRRHGPREPGQPRQDRWALHDHLPRQRVQRA